MKHRLAALLLITAFVGCADIPTPDVPLAPVQPNLSARAYAPPNNPIGAVGGPVVQNSYGGAASARLQAGVAPGAGDISLNFADTDIRTVVAQILGQILQVNYTIDPTVHGSATFHATTPLTNAQILPVLRALLAENGAVLEQDGDLYNVVPAAAPGGAGSGPAGAGPGQNSVVLPLHYADAGTLAGVLQPFVGPGGRIAAAPSGDAVIIQGDSTTRQTLVDLVSAFDIDSLAGQSYSLLPVDDGAAKDIADSLTTALAGKTAINDVRIVPLNRVNAVLVVAARPDELADVHRLFDLIQRNQSQEVRGWNVYYLQASNAEDLAYVLQQAFTPDNVTAVPTDARPSADQNASTTGGVNTGGISTGGISSSGITGGGIGAAGDTSGSDATDLGAPTDASAGTTGAAPSSTTNPLLGGLGGGGAQSGGASTDEMRIVPDPQNNALLIYATQSEDNLVNVMLAKIDVLPLEVRIDAVIAEVDLNNALQYGTQFFFKSNGINGILNNATQTLTSPSAVALDSAFPGFIIGGSGAGGAPFAISALNAVTTVKVLSSPELLVLNNDTAQLQVGSLVPYLTTSSQSTLTENAPIINSIQYQPTGVIMTVTPRVDQDGLVMLKISQNVSSVDTTAENTSGIGSPTFLQRSITSSVVVQDGQTVGLAGLISDNDSRTNSGIPWLKDIPILGALAGTQTNQRMRTELLVLLTPYVVYNQQDARALTQDLQQQLPNAAATPFDLQRPPEGLSDPNLPYRPVSP